MLFPITTIFVLSSKIGAVPQFAGHKLRTTEISNMSVYLSRNVVMKRQFAKDIIAASLTVPAAAPMPSGARFCMLWTNDFVPTPDSLVADFTEATFSGYVLSTGLGGAPFQFGPNAIGATFSSVFTSSAATPFVSETVMGYTWVSAAKADWYFAERFAEPIPIAEAGDQLWIHSGFDLSLYPDHYPT
jgi:hypothetical protein